MKNKVFLSLFVIILIVIGAGIYIRKLNISRSFLAEQKNPNIQIQDVTQLIQQQTITTSVEEVSVGNVNIETSSLEIISAMNASPSVATFSNFQKSLSEKDRATKTNDTKSESIVEKKSKEEKLYTMNDVAKHNSRQSCWTVIKGDVYDLTSWINKHPGGEEKILRICGKDGTEAFNRKHGGEQKPEQILEQFGIGKLKE